MGETLDSDERTAVSPSAKVGALGKSDISEIIPLYAFIPIAIYSNVARLGSTILFTVDTRSRSLKRVCGANL